MGKHVSLLGKCYPERYKDTQTPPKLLYCTQKGTLKFCSIYLPPPLTLQASPDGAPTSNSTSSKLGVPGWGIE